MNQFARLDKLAEKQRYDARAQGKRSAESVEELFFGDLRCYLRAPYEAYRSSIRQHVKSGESALEVCAGMGEKTLPVIEAEAQLTAVDVSAQSLQRLKENLGAATNAVACDAESLPFASGVFDCVVMAGGMSYGTPEKMDQEMLRVLRSGGNLILVDVLNHNPIYRLNRYIHYLRGNRSKSTLRNMPDMERLRTLHAQFQDGETRFFGTASFAMPAYSGVMGAKSAECLSDYLDRKIMPARMAFKFVFVGLGRL